MTMTPSHRAWAERFAGQLEDRVGMYRRIATGRDGQDVIVACLQHVIDRHRRMLAEAGPASLVIVDAAPAAPIAPPVGRAATAWSDPVFWADGTLDPFAGTHADRMRASAAVCRKLGYDAAAAGYEARADRAAASTDAPVGAIDEVAQAHLAQVAPFAAGPQLDMFG